MGMVSTSGLMVDSMRVIGRIIRCMDTVCTPGRTECNMQVSTKMTSNTDGASSNGLVVRNTRESG